MQIFDPLHPIRAKRLVWYIKHLPGLIVYYPLNETDGTVAYNKAPANLGTFNGATTGATVKTTGLLGKAYGFDGNDTIAVASFTIPTNTFSVGCIYARTAAEDGGDRVIDWAAGGPSGGFDIQHVTGDVNKVRLTIRNGGTTQATLTTTDLTQDQFYFILGTHEVNNANFYLNGVSQGTDTSVNMTLPTAALGIGSRSGGASNFTTGILQHVFITNSVLTATQIQKLTQIAGLA